MEASIFLNKQLSKKSININNFLTTRLKSSKKIIPIDPINTVINELDVYNNERRNCNKIRLTVEINPICSNVLFNYITEIVKDEGSSNPYCLNFSPLDREKLKNVIFHNDNQSFYGNIDNAIRDTQITNKANGFIYHCGLNIFNNHILRSQTFKTVCPINDKKEISSDNFNTIKDFMRTYEGESMFGYTDKKGEKNQNAEPDTKLHLYLNEEILSFRETAEQHLKEVNGWFGFYNTGKMKIHGYYEKDKSNKIEYDWFNVINSRQACDFINLYPEKDLFYFEPKYNSFKQRIEKNWHYCLTYPSSSTTENICFFDNTDVCNDSNERFKLTTLKAIYFDDSIKHDSGIDCIKIWSISKHGLKKDDVVNLYLTNKNEQSNSNVKKMVMHSLRVLDIEDDYTFFVQNEGGILSNKWVNINDLPEAYKLSEDKKTIFKDDISYYVVNNIKANVDDSAQHLSYAKTINGCDVQYYVRIFSKIPNWKLSEKKINQLFLQNNPNYMQEYQKYKYDFENHIGKLAFAKNIYNDNISEIVFSDDINIDYLQDNLKRPISEIYLTIIKNNEGYREWYGKGKDKPDLKAPNIEYSHCFGKVNCGFKLSESSLVDENMNNLLTLNNVDYDKPQYQGLPIKPINKIREKIFNDDKIQYFDDDEIQYTPYNEYNGDTNFYGDLCCFSNQTCYEQQIQDINFRFNTVQREMTKQYSVSGNFQNFSYDEILSDDYDEQGFEVNSKKIINNEHDTLLRREGYYYKPHYKIQIKSISNELTSLYPNFIKLFDVVKLSDINNLFKLSSLTPHGLGDGDKVYIFDKNSEKTYQGKVLINKEQTNPRVFNLQLDEAIPIDEDKNRYIFYKLPINTPAYAINLNDSSCRYCWREVIQNGMDKNSNNEIYPFKSGRLYINKPIILYLKRQNPSCSGILAAQNYPFDMPSIQKQIQENNYYNEKDIEC